MQHWGGNPDCMFEDAPAISEGREALQILLSWGEVCATWFAGGHPALGYSPLTQKKGG